MAQWHSSGHPGEVSAATNGLWRKGTRRFCSRGENPGLLPASGSCRQFSSQLHKEVLGRGPVQNSPQSGGLDAQWGKRSLCPCFTLPRGEYMGPPLLQLGPLLRLPVGPTSKQHRHIHLRVKHNGCCLLQRTLCCWYKWYGLLGSHPKDW